MLQVLILLATLVWTIVKTTNALVSFCNLANSLRPASVILVRPQVKGGELSALGHVLEARVGDLGVVHVKPFEVLQFGRVLEARVAEFVAAQGKGSDLFPNPPW